MSLLIKEPLFMLFMLNAFFVLRPSVCKWLLFCLVCTYGGESARGDLMIDFI